MYYRFMKQNNGRGIKLRKWQKCRIVQKQRTTFDGNHHDLLYFPVELQNNWVFEITNKERLRKLHLPGNFQTMELTTICRTNRSFVPYKASQSRYKFYRVYQTETKFHSVNIARKEPIFEICFQTIKKDIDLRLLRCFISGEKSCSVLFCHF